MRKTFLVMSRLIDLFVDILPIDELGFKHVKLQSEGRPPYNPETLLKLYHEVPSRGKRDALQVIKDTLLDKSENNNKTKEEVGGEL